MDEQNIKTLPFWTELLTDRELKTLRLANVYADHYQDAGIVGHNQLLLLSKLAEMLNRVSEQAGVCIPDLYRPEVTGHPEE